MFLKSIELNNFRNYSSLQLSFKDGINIFFGNNAQGKTNILESIYALGLTESHRNVQLATLLLKDSNCFEVNGIINDELIDTKLSLLFKDNRKLLKHDDCKVNKISDYIKKMKVIIFSPEDLFLIKGAKDERRKYINTQLSQINSNYYTVLNDYNKLLKERNYLIKSYNKSHQIDKDYFDIITSKLIEKNLIIMKNRYIYVKRVNEYIKNIYKELAEIDNLSLEYVPNLKIDWNNNNENNIEIIENTVKNLNINEMISNKTLFGIHFDDFNLYIGKDNIKNFGSQGQQRLAILSLKLSEMEIFKKYLNKFPILLLDDVFSELDDLKKNNLLLYIMNNTQTFITTTDLNNLNKEIISKSKLFNINNGKVNEVNNNG